MPFGNSTGPSGAGPRTGRAAGFCSGHPVPGYMNPAPYHPWPLRGGRGHGFRNRYYASGLTGWQRAAMGMPGAYDYAPPYPTYEMAPEQELNALRSGIKSMEEGIRRAQERITELEAKEDAKKK